MFEFEILKELEKYIDFDGIEKKSNFGEEKILKFCWDSNDLSDLRGF